jgi:hypothetical protein
MSDTFHPTILSHFHTFTISPRAGHEPICLSSLLTHYQCLCLVSLATRLGCGSLCSSDMYCPCRLSELIRLDSHSQARTLLIAVIVILDHSLFIYCDHYSPLSNSYCYCVAAREASIILTYPRMDRHLCVACLNHETIFYCCFSIPPQ